MSDDDKRPGEAYYLSRRETMAELIEAVDNGVTKHRCINCGEPVEEPEGAGDEWHHVNGFLLCDVDDLEGDVADPEEYEDDEAREEAQDGIDNFALCMDVKRQVTITLGTGGPHDELVAVVDRDGYVESVTYRYLDWFGSDLFERQLYAGDALYEYAVRETELWLETFE